MRKNPFAEVLVSGIGAGAGFGIGQKVIGGVMKNPEVGELVKLSKGGSYRGSEGKLISKEGGLLGFGEMYRVMLPGGEQVLVSGSAVKSLNPMELPWGYRQIVKPQFRLMNPDDMEIPWSGNHIKGTAMWNPSRKRRRKRHNPSEMEIPWSANHIKGTAMWNPMPPRCPIHGNFIKVHRGWRTVTCPVGGERLGIAR